MSGIKTLIDIENSKFNLLGLDYYIYLNENNGVVLGRNKSTNNNNIRHFKVPDIVEVLENGVFKRSNLVDIVLPKKLKELPMACFQACQSLDSVEIPDGLNYIREFAFYDCDKLQSVIIPESVMEIEAGAFYGCSNLQNINIPHRVEAIGDNTFLGCIKLQNITIPNSVSSIGEYAFSHCFSLESIIIPESITYIGECAFEGCRSIRKIVFDGKTELGVDCIPREFLDKEDFIIECPDNLIDFYSKQLKL